jgi:hypothetical protein
MLKAQLAENTETLKSLLQTKVPVATHEHPRGLLLPCKKSADRETDD